MSPVTDAVWSEHDTTPEAIEAALRALLVERHAENEAYVPARVLNMIVFVDKAWEGEVANRLRGVGRYHASRLLVLAYEPRRERLDARVMIASEGEPGPGQLALLRETVVVELGERHLDDLLTIADPLVVTDLKGPVSASISDCGGHHGHASSAPAVGLDQPGDVDLAIRVPVDHQDGVAMQRRQREAQRSGRAPL